MDYRVFINVIGWPVIGSDKETRGGPCSVCSYVMQQMPHPHSREAMNNYDNHRTMGSFINARGAQMWGRLGCLSIFCNRDLFLLGSKTGVSAGWCHRWVYSCPSVCCFSFFFLSLFYSSLTHKEWNKCLWKCDRVKMMSAVPETVI